MRETLVGYRVVIGAIVSVLAGGYAIDYSLKSWTLLRRGEKTAATCTNIEYRQFGTEMYGSPIWHVTFQASSGKTYETTVDASFAGLKKGGQIEVLFDPMNPGLVRANRFLSLWIPSMCAGFLFLLFSLDLFGLWRKNMKKVGNQGPCTDKVLVSRETL